MAGYQEKFIGLGVQLSAPFRNKLGLLLAKHLILALEKSTNQFQQKSGHYLRIVLDPNQIRRRTNWRLRPKYTVIRGVAGERLRVNLNDHIGWRTFLDSIFDPVPVILADIICADDGVVVDVGANVGTTSVPVAWLGNRVIGIEPSPGVLSDLSHNIALNSPLPYLVVNMAAGSPDTATGREYLELYSPEGNVGAGSLLKNWNDAGSAHKIELTQAETLDTMIAFLKPGRIDVIKIDIEGFEYEALQGMKEVLGRDKPSVVFEWRPDIMIATGEEVKDLRELFPAGYEFYGIQAIRQNDSSAFELSLLDFDLAGVYENVLARHPAGMNTATASEMTTIGHLDYDFSTNDDGPGRRNRQ